MKIRILQNIIYFYLFSLIFLCNAFSQTGWISQTIGTRKYVNVNFINANSGFLVGSDGSILKSTNLGTNWNVISFHNFGLTVLEGSVYDDNFFMVIAGGLNGGMVYSTTNAGQQWISGGDDITPVGSGFIGLRGMTILDKQIAYVCGFDFGSLNQPYLDGIIYKTANSGVNWFQSQRIGFDYYDIEFKEEIGYTINGEVVKTTNAGVNWGYIGAVFSPTFSITVPCIDTLYMSSEAGIVFRSTNAGVNWTSFQTPANDTLKNMFFIDAKTGFVVGDSGTIVKTTDAGENWTLQITGTTKNLRSVWFLNKDTGFVVGDSGIVLKTVTGGLLVNVYNTNEIIPDRFSLSQNYPNPFNPSTVIRYSIPLNGKGQTSNVKLLIYDVLGNEVATLVNENQNSGSYSVTFDGANLSSGIYFYKLETENFSEVKKMTLMK